MNWPIRVIFSLTGLLFSFKQREKLVFTRQQSHFTHARTHARTHTHTHTHTQRERERERRERERETLTCVLTCQQSQVPPSPNIKQTDFCLQGGSKFEWIPLFLCLCVNFSKTENKAETPHTTEALRHYQLQHKPDNYSRLIQSEPIWRHCLW